MWASFPASTHDKRRSGRGGWVAWSIRLVSPVLLQVSIATAQAQDRLIHTFGQASGLQPPIWALAQDSTGFLWIGAEGGLYRFDGAEFRRWAPEEIREAIDVVTVSPTGSLTVLTRSIRAFEVTPTGARPVSLPRATGASGRHRLAFDRHGRLWFVHDDVVSYRTTEGTWQTLPGGALAGEQPRRVKANPAGGVDVMTAAALWRVAPNEAPQRLLGAPFIADVWYHSVDRFVAVTANPPGADRLIEVDRGARRHLLERVQVPLGRPISVVERQGTLWVALDGTLFGVRKGEPPDVLGLSEGINSGGPLLVDREGSLWMGSFVGLLHFPEPDSRTWSDRHGLRSRHARMLGRSGDLVWIASWGGTEVLRRTRGTWAIERSASGSQIRPCVDSRGAIWTFAGGNRGVLEMLDASTFRRHSRPHSFEGCAPARDGGMWMALAESLFHVDPTHRRVRASSMPVGNGRHDALLHDRHDRLWVSGGESICHAPVARVPTGKTAWACDTLPGAAIAVITELPSGTLWAASITTGVYARRNGRWAALPMETLPTRTVFSLALSPRGGVWIIGHGILERVEETPSGWTVVERLTQWQGLMSVGGGDLIEDDDGTIWIASDRGVTRVPASARPTAPAAPPIALVDARVDDRRVPLDSALQLPHDRNRLELRFAALSFRDPSQVRHQVRLGPNESWSESNAGASFRWVDLPARQYRVEYRASLDGRTWSTRPLRFAFSVRPAWYRTPWATALALGVIAVLGWIVYRARVAYLLGLERQRTRIALDLHDEVGSGLASVGILSGVLAADSLSAAERRQAAGDIASAAEELGNALSDIVWSLDPQAATLEELASRLAEHGERLSARGDVDFSSRFPDAWPADRLDVSLRRNVLLVGLEALHNAVRHARASQVALTLSPNDGLWVLSIRDDGIGFDARSPNNGRHGHGHGLSGMRRRAEEIGAHLGVHSAPGAGTTVTLRFNVRRVAARADRLTTRLRRKSSAPPA